MKLNILYNDPNNITIESYLAKCGVEQKNIERYLHPKPDCLESVDNYKGMEKGWELVWENV